MRKTQAALPLILVAALVLAAVPARAGGRNDFVSSLVKIQVAVAQTKKKGREERVERVKIRLEDAAMDTWVIKDDAKNIRDGLAVLVREMQDLTQKPGSKGTLERLLKDLRTLDSDVFLLDRDIHSALSQAPRDKRLAKPAKWLHGTLKNVQGEDQVLLDQAAAAKKHLDQAGLSQEAAEIVSRIAKIVSRVAKALRGVENLLTILGEFPPKK